MANLALRRGNRSQRWIASSCSQKYTSARGRVSRESESHRVETIETDLKAFDADVFGIIDRVAPQLKSASAQESLARLSAGTGGGAYRQ